MSESNGRILFVDDEETFLYSTSELLRKENFIVDCGEDADEAIKLLKENVYDLIISDIKMPNNNDLRLVKMAKTVVGSIPIILVTGYPSVDTAMQSVHLPVSAYLIKPIDFDQLLQHTKKAIALKQIYTTIDNARNRLTEIQSASSQMGDSFDAFEGGNESFPSKAFLDLSYQNIFGSLSDIKEVLNINQSEKFADGITNHLSTTDILKSACD